ncbi:DUF1559 domain-containing protein [Aeoliella mucimassa]|uniref:Fimbrial protein n=1 Tax=Aeoliella mucimassa TaxID=2527972 RepID=A0A518AN05_9BACT|nr:DUF1559 domain-containing protein [Aeoliella mucimassa]QDU56104.1 Fimbrial protein precursor [Aeoliella mucimassa]
MQFLLAGSLRKQSEKVQSFSAIRRPAFTLVELLVVIAIIGILVALLLPAVQAARESARRAQCISQQKNLSLAMLNHESTYGSWPSSGWFGSWTGDPDRGSGPDQPGSWIYSILPFVEQEQLHDLGTGLTGAARSQAFITRDSTPLPIMNCPSRRQPRPYPSLLGGSLSGNGQGGVISYDTEQQARSDYAVNVGDVPRSDLDCQAISPRNYTTTPAGWPPRVTSFSGISYCGASVKIRNVTDGMSKTFAIGERYLPESKYETGDWIADDWSMYTGFQDDTARSTFYDGLLPTHQPAPDSTVQDDFKETDAIWNNQKVRVEPWREVFGGPHPGGVVMAMCDGSVDLVEYDIDPQVYRRMGHRSDDGENVVFKRR